METFKKYEKKIYLGIAVFVLIISISAVSYALWTTTHTQSGQNTINTGCFDIQFTEGNNQINLTNAYPITDSAGQSSKGYTFTVTNKCTIDAKYDVILNISSNTIDSNSKRLKIYVSGDSGTNVKNLSTKYLSDVSSATPTNTNSSAKLLLSDEVSKATSSNGTGGSKTYTLRLWIDANAVTASNQTLSKGLTFNGSIGIRATQAPSNHPTAPTK